MRRISRNDTSRRRASRGLTLIESTISIALVALVVVTSLDVAGACARLRGIDQAAPRAHHLAARLLAEILEVEYEEPIDVVSFGREAGEAPGSRLKYDDVDDYHGWSSTPPKNKSGGSVHGFVGWTRSVSVARVASGALDAPVGGETGLKRIIVTVTDPAGRNVSVTGLRTKKGAIDHRHDHDRTFLSQIRCDLRVGSDAGAGLLSGVPLLNEADGGVNLLANAGFELAATSWSSVGGTLVSSADAYFDDGSIELKNRVNKDADLRQDVTSVIKNGQGYRVAAWVKTGSGTEQVSIGLHVATSADGELVYWTMPIDVGTTWTRVTSVLVPAWTGPLDSARWRISTWPDGSAGDLVVDDALMMETP